MIQEIRVKSKDSSDVKGLSLKKEIEKTLKIKGIKQIRTAKVYRLEGISEKVAEAFAKKALFEEITQEHSLNKKIYNDSSTTIEVAYKPGVMNPEVASIIKIAKDLKINVSAADSSWEYVIFGNITKEEKSQIISKLLVNETVEMVVAQKPTSLLIGGSQQKTKTIPIRTLSDDKLMSLSKDRLFLNLEEMKIIQEYFKKIDRDATDVEVEILAQTWSEHCVHKTFKAKLVVDGKEKRPLITRIKETAKYNSKIIVSAFVDNSGVIDFFDGYSICGKCETHNSPSAIEPYGGAMTGSGGVFRDILGTGKGAKVLISTDIFCFAPPNLKQSELPPGCLAPEYLLRKVVYGVRDYGNRVGIPTNNGSIHFHKDFRAKPTVAVGAYGLIKTKDAKKQEPLPGDLIVTLGGRTGRDGIHGATFSSAEMTDRTINVSGSAVQIGNAIEEKRTIDLILTLSKEGLIRAITDCGAGGFSSAVGEMAKETGATVNLENVPLKYPNLAPWEIFLSESQERMVIALEPNNLKRLKVLAQIYNVEIAVFGKFDNTKRLKVFYKKEKVCDLDMHFMHDGLPQRTMVATTNKKDTKVQEPSSPKNLENTFIQILSHGNVCSKESIVRMYDHNVGGNNALHPFSGVNYDGPNDGAIVKPFLNKNYGLATAHGLNPQMVKIDPYWGSIWAITEAVSNYIAIGGDLKTAALMDNFIWPFPDEESLADLDKAVDACCEMAKILNMPFVSGKDSLSSTYRYKDGKVLKIPPVVLISVFGKIKQVNQTISADIKSTNSTLVLIGKTDFNNLGGTTYFDVTKSKSTVPKVDIDSLSKVISSVTKAIKSGQILSVHDISEGGIGSAIAEMCFGGDCGAVLDLSKIDKLRREDFILFSETPGTFLAEVENEKTAKKLFTKVPYKIIGKTQREKIIEIRKDKKLLAKLNTEKLKRAWQKPMMEVFT